METKTAESDILLSSDVATEDSEQDNAYLINTVYYHIIITYVRFCDVVPMMSTFPSIRAIAAEMYNLDHAGKHKEAGVKFMAVLKSSNEPGKYRAFLQALRDLEYLLLLNWIETGEVRDNHEEHIRLLEIFTNPLQNKIDARIMAEELYAKKVIHKNDLVKIKGLANNPQWAAFELLDVLPRRNPDWYKSFLEILYDHHHHQICKEIDPKFYDSKKKQTPDDYNLDSVDDFPSPPIFQPEIVPEDSQLKSLSESDSFVLSDSGDVFITEKTPGTGECRCSCAEQIEKKFEELKSVFERKFESLEIKLNYQISLLQTLLHNHE